MDKDLGAELIAALKRFVIVILRILQRKLRGIRRHRYVMPAIHVYRDVTTELKAVAIGASG